MSRRRKLGLAFLALLLLPLVALVVGYLWLLTPAGNRMLQQQVVTLVNGLMEEGSFELDGLRTNLLRTTQFSGLRVLDGDGEPVISLDEAELDYRLRGLVNGTLVVEVATLSGPEVDLVVDEDGALNLSRLFPSSESDEPSEGLPIEVVVKELRVSGGRVAYTQPESELRVEELEITLSGRAEGNTYAAERLLLSGGMTAPEAGSLGLSGRFTWDDGELDLPELAARVGDAAWLRVSGSGEELLGEGAALDLAVQVERLDMDELEVLTGDLGVNGVIRGGLSAKGPLSALVVAPDLQVAGGTATGDITLDVASERLTWSAGLDLQSVDAEALLDTVTEPTTLTSRVDATGGGTTWPDDLVIDGTVRLADSVTWGYAIPDAVATVAWEGGRGKLTGIRYRSDYGELTGDGIITDSLLDLDLNANIWRLSGLEEFGASDLEGNGRAEGRLFIDWSGEVAEVTFDGRAWGSRLGYVNVFDAGVWASPVNMRWDGDTWVAGELEAASVLSYGIELAQLRGPWTVEVFEDGAVSWEVPELGVEGVGAFGAGVGAAVGSVSGTYSVDEVVRNEVGLYLSALSYGDFSAESGTAQVSLNGDRLGLDVDLYEGEETVTILTGGADLEAAAYTFDALMVGPESGVAWRNEGPVEFILGDAGVKDASIKLTSQRGEVELLGTLGVEGPLDGTVGVEALELEWLSALSPAAEGLKGKADVDLTLRGDASDLVVDGRLNFTGLYVPGEPDPETGDDTVQLADVDLVVDVGLGEGHFTFDGDVAARGSDPPKAEGPMPRTRVALAALRGELPVHIDLTPLVAEEGELPPISNAPLSNELMYIDYEEAARVQVVVYPVSLGRLAQAIPSLGEPLEGRVSGELLITGSPLEPDIELLAGVHLPVGEAGEWVRSDLSLEVGEGEMVLKGDAWERGERRLEFTGGAQTDLDAVLSWAFKGVSEGQEPPALDDPRTYVDGVQLRAVPLGVPVETLAVFMDVPDGLEGRVSGAVMLSGEPQDPKLSGGLLLLEGKLGDVFVAPAVLGVEPLDDGYQVVGTFGFSESEDEVGTHSLNIIGQVPFHYSLSPDYDLDAELAREGLQIDVSGTGVPFAVMSIVDPAIEDGYGVVSIEGEVGGSLATPKPDLRMEMDNGAFRYRDIGVSFVDMELRASLHDELVDITTLRFQTVPQANLVKQTWKQLQQQLRTKEGRRATAGCGVAYKDRPALRSGEVRVSGRSTLLGFALADVDFDICAYEAWFSDTRDMGLQISADLDMTGPWPEVLVAGDVDADDIFFKMDEADFFDGGGLQLDPALTIQRSSGSSQQVDVEDLRPFYWPFRFELALDLKRRAVIDVTVPMLDTYDALGLSTLRLKDTTLDGVLDLVMEKDDLSLVGEVQTRRGVVSVMKKDFELSEESTIIFSGQEYSNPTLDITATYATGTYGDVGVRITQTAELPAIDFSSDDGYSLTDLLSILLVGRPTTEMGQAGGGVAGDITSFVAAQATGVVTDQLEVFGGGDSLVDSLQFTGEGSTVLSSVTFGWTIGDRTYVELELNRDPDDEDEAPTEVTLEYVLSRRLEGVFHIGGEQSADIYANWRF